MSTTKPEKKGKRILTPQVKNCETNRKKEKSAGLWAERVFLNKSEGVKEG